LMALILTGTSPAPGHLNRTPRLPAEKLVVPQVTNGRNPDGNRVKY
jgi:hypothetical protein